MYDSYFHSLMSFKPVHATVSDEAAANKHQGSLVAWLSIKTGTITAIFVTTWIVAAARYKSRYIFTVHQVQAVGG